MELFRSVPSGTGHFAVFAPGDAGLEQLGLEVVRLAAGETYAASSGQREIAAVILSGVCDVTVQENVWNALGGRKNVFSGKATAVYIPPGSDFELVGAGDRRGRDRPLQRTGWWRWSLFTVCGHARSGDRQRPGKRRLPPASARHHRQRPARSSPRGGRDLQRAGVVVELSSPQTRCGQPTGGVQDGGDLSFQSGSAARLWRPGPLLKRSGPPLDEAHIIRENTAVALPFGYHPVAAAPGYRVYYLWFLSGSTRELLPNDDPDHAWVKSL